MDSFVGEHVEIPTSRGDYAVGVVEQHDTKHGIVVVTTDDGHKLLGCETQLRFLDGDIEAIVA